MIPNEVKVAGITYKVSEKDYVEINVNKNCLGSCSYADSNIVILNSLSNTRKEQVFVHELVHAVLMEAGYDEHDEDMVNRIGIVLHQVLKENELKF
jgi:Zn-dependent peptidase ImmA (M78 family)